MSTLRRLLHIVAGWILGVLVTLAWVWVGEGKATTGPGSGALVTVLALLATLLSVLTLGCALVALASYAIDGRES